MNEEQVKEEGSAESTTQKKKDTKGRGMGGMVLAVVALLIIVGAAVLYMQRENSAVAMVNGEKITHAEFKTKVKEIERAWQFEYDQGIRQVPSTDAEIQSLIKNEAINGLVNEMILMNAARDAGIEVAETEVDTVIENYRAASGSAADFRSDLKEAGITEKSLRDRIRTELTAQAYVEQNASAEELAVADNEFEDLYNANREALGEDMTLDDFKLMYGPSLEMNKFEMALFSILESLRGQADVDILIELPAPQGDMIIDPAEVETEPEGSVEEEGSEGEEVEAEGEITE